MFHTERTEVQIPESMQERFPESVEARFDAAIPARAEGLRHKLPDCPILPYRIVDATSFLEKGPQYCGGRPIAACLVDDDGGMSITVKHEISRNKMFFCVWI